MNTDMDFRDFLRSTPRMASEDLSVRLVELVEYDREMEWIRYSDNVMYLYRVYYQFYNGLLTKYSYLPKSKIDKKIRKMANYCLNCYVEHAHLGNKLVMIIPPVSWELQYKEYCKPADIYQNIFLTLPHRKELMITFNKNMIT